MKRFLIIVAAGRTNRQIGQALFITEKTASLHVSHILTNPLLSGNVYDEALPGPCAELAAQVTSLEQLVRENTQPGEAGPGEIRASFALLPDGPRPRPRAARPVVAREPAPVA